MKFNKLYPPPLDFILNCPARKYFKSFIWGKNKLTNVLLLTQKGSAQFIGGEGEKGKCFFSDDLNATAGAPAIEMFNPEINDLSVLTTQSKYNRDVFKKYGLGRNGKLLLIMEPDRMYLNYHSTEDMPATIRETIDFLEKEPSDVLAAWNYADDFLWCIFTDKLQPAPGNIIASNLGQLFFCGIPKSLATFACEYAWETDQPLCGIVPYQLAVASYVLSMNYEFSELFFLLVPSASAFSLFTFQDKKCIQFVTFPNDNAVYSEVMSSVMETQDIVQRNQSEFNFLVWPSIGFSESRMTSDIRTPANGEVIFVNSKNGFFKEGMSGNPNAYLCNYAARIFVPYYKNSMELVFDLTGGKTK